MNKVLREIIYKKRFSRPSFYIGLIVCMSVISQITIPKFPRSERERQSLLAPEISPDSFNISLLHSQHAIEL